MEQSSLPKLVMGARQRTAPVPGRVISLRPSAWERVRTWARSTLTEERIAEPTLVAATLVLLGWLFYCLYHGLQHYTIRPLP